MLEEKDSRVKSPFQLTLDPTGRPADVRLPRTEMAIQSQQEQQYRNLRNQSLPGIESAAIGWFMVRPLLLLLGVGSDILC